MTIATDAPATPEEFNGLRLAAGLSTFSTEAAEIALGNTLHGVWIRDEAGQLIAMARLSGDGGCFALVTDVAVHPKCQRKGLGLRVMRHLMQWADANLPSGAIISLIADEGADALYRKVGFEQRTGMLRITP